jgi:hypothetical protein
MKFKTAMAVAAALGAPAAWAATLTVVDVVAPKINCVFDASCTP